MTTKMHKYIQIDSDGVPIKAWAAGVEFEESAIAQLRNTALSPVIHGHLAVMPDCHWGMGATIGSVIPTLNAVIPAAVGVDIGCGMMAVKTTLTASDLPESLRGMRLMIEHAVPHGRSSGRRGGGRRDKGAWGDPPTRVGNLWSTHLQARFADLCERYPVLKNTNHLSHLGTLGTGNHFIEVCLDEADAVWFMLHSGSRGVGNRIATVFIEKAKKDMEAFEINLPDEDLSYLSEGTPHYRDYIEAVQWAQDFARINRQVMMENVITAVQKVRGLPEFKADLMAVNCHHNYVSQETHFGEDLLITRKGAVRAGLGELGIIPGSMGAKSFIVRGLGNEESFCSCSHGAGRVMSRRKAKATYSVDDQIAATQGVECRKDAAVIDEIPMAYKDIEAVMEAQSDLVEIVHTLKQVVCVKG
jgi:tRNA-splicing ligase RtcB (3'-phosphate/5'-hydroxy nucleic acid ligase)